MLSSLQKSRSSKINKILSTWIALSFLCTMILPPGVASAQTVQGIFNLPTPGSMIPLSAAHLPCIMQGVTVYYDNPFQFDFIIDTGNDDLKSKDQIKNESRKLIKYFLASLTIPEEDLWVNLSPHEEDNIIADSFSKTEMGRDMLSQDYILKQLSSSLIYPEEQLGSEFWDAAYAKAQEKYGTTQIPLNTFNKVWIVPEKAVVFESAVEPTDENPSHGRSAFVVESRLKVMMEEDYLAMTNNLENAELGTDQVDQDNVAAISNLTSEIYRDIILPEIEKEVNQGKTFASLRQIFNSMLLAIWYKQNLKESILGQVYANQNKINGVDIEDKQAKQKIYDQYVAALHQGVFNYIKEDYDQYAQEPIPRKYFSGGLNFAEWAKENLQTIDDLKNPEHIKTIQREGWAKKFRLAVALAGIKLQDLSADLADVGVADINELQDETIDALLHLAHDWHAKWISTLRIYKGILNPYFEDEFSKRFQEEFEKLKALTRKMKTAGHGEAAKIIMDELDRLLEGKDTQGIQRLFIKDQEALAEALGIDVASLFQGHASDTYGIHLLTAKALIHELGAYMGLTDIENIALEVVAIQAKTRMGGIESILKDDWTEKSYRREAKKAGYDVNAIPSVAQAWESITKKIVENFPDGQRKANLLREMGNERDIAKAEIGGQVFENMLKELRTITLDSLKQNKLLPFQIMKLEEMARYLGEGIRQGVLTGENRARFHHALDFVLMLSHMPQIDYIDAHQLKQDTNTYRSKQEDERSIFSNLSSSLTPMDEHLLILKSMEKAGLVDPKSAQILFTAYQNLLQNDDVTYGSGKDQKTILKKDKSGNFPGIYLVHGQEFLSRIGGRSYHHASDRGIHVTSLDQVMHELMAFAGLSHPFSVAVEMVFEEIKARSNGYQWWRGYVEGVKKFEGVGRVLEYDIAKILKEKNKDYITRLENEGYEIKKEWGNLETAFNTAFKTAAENLTADGGQRAPDLLTKMDEANRDLANQREDEQKVTKKLSEAARAQYDSGLIMDLDAGDVFNNDQIEALEIMAAIGQAHIVNDAYSSGFTIEQKKALLDQIAHRNRTYPDGLIKYMEKAREKMKIWMAKGNPFDEVTSLSQPTTQRISNVGGSTHQHFVDKGWDVIGKTVFAMPAGGLGERLGYKGIKLGLPFEMMTEKPYAEEYISNILAMQKEYNKKNQADERIPLVLMTSQSNHQMTLDLFEANDNFGMDGLTVVDINQDYVVFHDGQLVVVDKAAYLENKELTNIRPLNQLVIFQQEDVFAFKGDAVTDAGGNVTDVKLNFILGKDGRLMEKPHNHGDIHILMAMTGMAQAFKNAGKSHSLFFQDTNGEAFNAVLPGLGVSKEKGYATNLLTVKRVPGDATGAVMVFDKKDGSQMVGNIEYSEAPMVAKSFGMAEEEFDLGNINVYVVDQEAYVDVLDRTGGMMAEIVNPKPDTMIGRLEGMMQDIAKEMNARDVGVTNFPFEFIFAATKNNLKRGLLKAANKNFPEHMAATEGVHYRNKRLMLQQAGATIDVEGRTRYAYPNKYYVQYGEEGRRVIGLPGEEDIHIGRVLHEIELKGIPFKDGARVSWSPDWAQTIEQVKAKWEKGRIMNRSFLRIEGENIYFKDLDLDGTLIVKARPDQILKIEGLQVKNRGWELEYLSVADLADESIPEHIRLRGYRFAKKEQKVIDITDMDAGEFTVDEAGNPVGVNTYPRVEEVVEETKTTGGIDFNPALFDLQVKRDENGIPLPLPEQPVYNLNVNGFVPVIIDVIPITNMNMLLGINSGQDKVDRLSRKD